MMHVGKVYFNGINIIDMESIQTKVPLLLLPSRPGVNHSRHQQVSPSVLFSFDVVVGLTALAATPASDGSTGCVRGGCIGWWWSLRWRLPPKHDGRLGYTWSGF